MISRISVSSAVACVALTLLVAGCNARKPSNPAPPAGAPEIFAEGVVSTEAPEFGTSLTPDGQTVYFNRAAGDRSTLVIMRSRFEAGAWQAADTASFSGTWRDVDPFVAPDGTRLYFSSDRPTESGDGSPDFNTWVVLLSPGGEDEPALLPPPLNSDSTEVFVSAAASGALYFSSNRDGVMRSYRASTAGTDAEVTVIPIDMNLDEGVGNPAISADESRLAFVARRDDGIGGADIYVSFATENGWLPARLLLAPTNSTFADFAPYWSPDGEYLYFTSERPGVAGPVDEDVRPPGDIYRVAIETIVGP